MHPEPLQTGQDRRQLVPAPEGQANLFDGRDLEIGLGSKGGGRMVENSGECCRVRRRNPHKRSIAPAIFAPSHSLQTQCIRAHSQLSPLTNEQQASVVKGFAYVLQFTTNAASWYDYGSPFQAQSSEFSLFVGAS